MSIKTSLVAASLGALILIFAVLGRSSTAESPSSGLLLDFDSAPTGAVVTSVENTGTAPVSGSVVTTNGGEAVSVASRNGQTNGVQLPAFDPTAAGPRAVIAVVTSGTTEVLSPGKRSFSWGADFKVDAVSASKETGSTDNGDNLVQRGLAGSHRQFKLELDKRQPACRVEASAGSLRVQIPVTVEPTSWYRATCTRVYNTVTATLVRYDADGNVTDSWTRSATRSKGLGTLTWVNPQVPVSVGGKLTNDGRVVSTASDQFNGVVDNVVLDITN